MLKFARLVDAGSFTRAARDMHISQPALTTAVKKLERELRAELLIRSNHTLALTEPGQLAYRTAKDIVAQTTNLRAGIASATHAKPTLRLGLIDGLADLLFVQGEYLAPLEQKTRLSLTVDNTSRLITYVEHDALDIALIARPDSLSRSLEALPIGDEPMVIVTHVHRLPAVHEQLASGELGDFLAYNQSSHTHQLIARYLQANHIAVTYSFYSTSPEIMLALLREGRGVAALPYLLVKPYVDSGELAIVRLGKEASIARPIAAIKRQGRQTIPAATELIAAARHNLVRTNVRLSEQT